MSDERRPFEASGIVVGIAVAAVVVVNEDQPEELSADSSCGCHWSSADAAHDVIPFPAGLCIMRLADRLLAQTQTLATTGC